MFLLTLINSSITNFDKTSYLLHDLKNFNISVLSTLDNVQKNENKTKRLRNNLRELEDLLVTTTSTSTDGNLSVVWSTWRSSIVLQIMFSNGLIANLMLDKLGNLEKVTFDKVQKYFDIIQWELI